MTDFFFPSVSSGFESEWAALCPRALLISTPPRNGDGGGGGAVDDDLLSVREVISVASVNFFFMLETIRSAVDVTEKGRAGIIVPPEPPPILAGRLLPPLIKIEKRLHFLTEKVGKIVLMKKKIVRDQKRKVESIIVCRRVEKCMRFPVFCQYSSANCRIGVSDRGMPPPFVSRTSSSGIDSASSLFSGLYRPLLMMTPP